MKGLIRNVLTTGMFALAVATTPVLQGTAWAVDVEGLEIVAGDTTDFLIRLTEGADGAAVSAFTMSDPARVIVDIADVRAVEGLEEMSGDGLVDQILISTIEDDAGVITRVEVFLTGEASHTFSVDPGIVRLTLEGSDSSRAVALADDLASALGAPEPAEDAVVEERLPELGDDPVPACACEPNP